MNDHGADIVTADGQREVVRHHGSVLADFEKEAITKSYKLVTPQALQRIGALCTGARRVVQVVGA